MSLSYDEYISLRQGTILEHKKKYYVLLGETYNNYYILATEIDISCKNITNNIGLIPLNDLIYVYSYSGKIEIDINLVLNKLKLLYSHDLETLKYLNNVKEIKKFTLTKLYRDIKTDTRYKNLYYVYVTRDGNLLSGSNLKKYWLELKALKKIPIFRISCTIQDNVLLTRISDEFIFS